MDYIYRFRVRRSGDIVKDFALPTWNESLTKRIEKATHNYFEDYQEPFTEEIEIGLLEQYIKIGRTDNPKRRLYECNKRPESGKTEYFLVKPIVSLRMSGFVFIRWLWFTVVRPLLIVALIAVLTLLVASFLKVGYIMP